MALQSVLAGIRAPVYSPVDAFAQGASIGQNIKSSQLNNQATTAALEGQKRQQAIQRLSIVGRLAQQVKNLPIDQRQAYIQQLDPQLMSSIGITPEELAQVKLDDQSLDNLISKASAVSSASNPANQYRKESVSTNQGLMVFDPSTGQYRPALDQSGKPLTAAQYDTELQQDISGARTRGGLEARTEIEPQLQAAITSAKEAAKAEASKIVKQQGQLGKIEDADRLYKNLSDADLDLIYGQGERWYPEFFRSQKGIDLIAQRDQLVGMLNLAARGQLAGQGAVSDTEAKAILESATTLANPNISPGEAKSALDSAMRQIYRNAGKTFNPDSPAGATPGINSNIPEGYEARYQRVMQEKSRLLGD